MSENARESGAVREMAKMLRAGGISYNRFMAAPTVADVRLLAKRKLPKMAFDFIDGGAGDELTLRANVDDLAKVQLLPRSLVDITTVKTKTTLFGNEMPVPLFLSPCGLMRIAGGEGELAAVRAAGEAGITYTISTASSWSIEEIAQVATGPLWFQLYLWRSREVVKNLVDRAQAVGCQALVVTLDVPVNGKRTRDHRNGMSIPPKITPRNAWEVATHPKWFLDLLRGPAIGFRNLQGIAEGSSAMSHQEYVNTELINPRASWEDIDWLRRQWKGPILVKGVMSVDDAVEAQRHGIDGIVVSNHGGRQLDSVPSSISLLPRILDSVSGKTEVLIDGGFRSGTDVIKGIGMGASAVGMGRSWAYGVAAGQMTGVQHVLKLLNDEIVETLQLLGHPDIASVGRAQVEYPDGWNVPQRGSAKKK